MSMKTFRLPRGVLISVFLNIVTFIIYVFSGSQQERKSLFTAKNIFVATIILTVVNLFIANIEVSWKTGRGFYLNKQYYLLFGQVLIAALIVAVAVAVISFLINNFIIY